MKKIYLIQKMKRGPFQKWARKGIKVQDLNCYDLVMTMWCESKRNAIKTCRSKNRETKFEVFFVVPVNVF